MTGYLPSGVTMKAATIPADVLSSTWGAPIPALLSLPAYQIASYKVYGGRKGNPLIPNDRVMWQLGSLANPRPLLLLSKNVNLVKGMLFDFAKNENGIFMGKLRRSLINDDLFDTYLEGALRAGGQGIDKCFQPIRAVSGVPLTRRSPATSSNGD